MNDIKPPALGGTWGDTATALVKGSIGAIPVAGSILAEVVGLVIPNQRISRIERYLKFLSERLGGIEKDALRAKFEDPQRVDLFEEGVVQSVRAISDERKRYIARLVAEGISGDEKQRIESKRLMELLEEVDDDQIVILTSYLSRHHDDDAFREKHAAVLAPVLAHMQSTREELDASTIHDLARDHLQRLGLLRSRYKNLKKGEVPEFDSKTGMMKSNGRDVTPLGRLLLVKIGLAEPDEV
jgi:hypothetical protein